MKKFKLLIIFSFLHFIANGQISLKRDNYFEIKSGVYKTKSLDTLVAENNSTLIKPQNEFKELKNIAFLQIQNKEIVLFDRIAKNDRQKVLGYLKETSVVEIDTIFYNRIYKDITKEWFLTYDVWYGLRINGECYYTDFKVHDFIAYQKELKEFNQKLLLVAQNTGYDELYDNGYPEYFFVIILNSKNQVIFNSKLLDFNYGDEFWESEFNVKTNYTENGNFVFKIVGLEETYTGVWTGKELKKE